MPVFDKARKVRGDDTPESVRFFEALGLENNYRAGVTDFAADCPFCGGSAKFVIKTETGQWRCLTCNTAEDDEGVTPGKVFKGGNQASFIRLFYQLLLDRKLNGGYVEKLGALAKDRRVSAASLTAWGVVYNHLSGEWLVPGFFPDGRVGQLYRYADPSLRRNGTKARLLALPGTSHGLLGVNMLSREAKTVYLCEGPWDAMKLWEVLSTHKRVYSEGNGDSAAVFEPTSALSASLLADTSVLAVPGCGVFSEKWYSLFKDVEVVLLYDNDHPKFACPNKACGRTYSRYTHNSCGVCKVPLDTSKEVPPPAYTGTKRTAAMLSASEDHPSKIYYLAWGGNDTPADSSLPDGYDVRDALSPLGPESRGGGKAGASLGPTRAISLAALFDRVTEVPVEWLSSGSTGGKVAKLGEAKCSSWKELVTSWRKAMQWTDGLDCALSVMLASITSTQLVGDQLWCKIIGPPSCGKSVLCEAVSANAKYVVAKSTIRGFHSGFKSDKRGEIDHSLIAELNGKTLVTKDGDTLLQSPNLQQILAEARDIYDTTSRTHYRHGLSRDYDRIRTTWLLCGTESLRILDSSELGERFLDCVVVHDMEEELEDSIGWRVALRAEREVGILAKPDDADSSEGPEMVAAKRLTAGYISYLRENADVFVGKVFCAESALKRIYNFAKFVAFIRSRPSTRQAEKAQRELCFRLVSQHVRLAKTLAAVLGKNSVDKEVLRRTRKVSLDTARGRTLNIATFLRGYGEKGAEIGGLVSNSGETEAKERDMLRFLRKIGVVEHYKLEGGRGVVGGRTRWRLTPSFERLYDIVMADGEEGTAEA